MTHEKKIKLNDKQKMIINITVTIVQILVVLICITASIIILVNPASTTIGKTSTSLLPVLSNSMDGKEKTSFKKGDLIVSKKPDSKKWNAAKLKIGDIITYEEPGTTGKYVTHRITKIVSLSDTKAVYQTKGDANPNQDSYTVGSDMVLGIYKSHMKGVGKSILWLQTPKNFLLVIILPLALLFIYNILMFVMTIMRNRLEKQAQMQAGEGVSEEKLKEQIIAEYLAKQSQEQSSDSDAKVIATGEESDSKDSTGAEKEK